MFKSCEALRYSAVDSLYLREKYKIKTETRKYNCLWAQALSSGSVLEQKLGLWCVALMWQFGDIFMCQISIAYDHNDFVFEIHLNLLFALEIIHCK